MVFLKLLILNNCHTGTWHIHSQVKQCLATVAYLKTCVSIESIDMSIVLLQAHYSHFLSSSKVNGYLDSCQMDIASLQKVP
jgi:hypothetical protein